MKPRGSVAGPLILIAIGVLFMLHTISPTFPIADWMARYWPFLLIIWGVIQLVEICLRAARNQPLPVSGISGGAWVLVILICCAGLVTSEVRRPDAWWRQVGFEPGMEVFGQEHDYTVSTQRQVVGKAPHIVIESFRGDAKIAGTDTEELVLNGNKSIRTMEARDAERADRETPVEMIVERNTVTIRCNQTRTGVHGPVATNLDLSVPKDASIEVTGLEGDFDISSLSGDIDISSQNSGMRFDDIGGNVKIDTRRSDLLRCTNVKGSVDVRGHGNDVELEKIAGRVTITGDYDGTVSLREVARSIRVQDRQTQFEIEQLPGEIRVERGTLNAQNMIGPVKLVTHATDVTLDGFSDGLELTADKGDIDLTPGRLPLSKMIVHTRSGNIELVLPERAAFALTASTDRGEIQNEFGAMLKEQSQGAGARLEGSIGTGPELTLTTDRGSITVRKSSGDDNGAKETGAQKPSRHTRLNLASLAGTDVRANVRLSSWTLPLLFNM